MGKNEETVEGGIKRRWAIRIPFASADIDLGLN
jgi:hypothetical protein